MPAGSPTLVVMVNGKTSGPVYTTRDLLVRVRLSGGAYYSVNSFDVTGMRRIPHPDGDEALPNEAMGIADSPGTLDGDRGPDERRRRPALHGQRHRQLRDQGGHGADRLQPPQAARLQGPPSVAVGLELLVLGQAGADGRRRPLTVEARAIKRATRSGAGRAREERHLPDAPVRRPEARPGRARELRVVGADLPAPHPDLAGRSERQRALRWAAARYAAFVKVMMDLPRGRADAPLLAQEDPGRARYQGAAGWSDRSRGSAWPAAATRGASSRSAASRSCPPRCRAENPLRNVLPLALGGP